MEQTEETNFEGEKQSSDISDISGKGEVANVDVEKVSTTTSSFCVRTWWIFPS